MVKQSIKNVTSCDVCGKEVIIENPYDIPYDKEDMPEKIGWISISVSRYLGRNNGSFNYHGIDICPDCYRPIFNYLKENCDNASTWPKDL